MTRAQTSSACQGEPVHELGVLHSLNRLSKLVLPVPGFTLPCLRYEVSLSCYAMLCCAMLCFVDSRLYCSTQLQMPSEVRGYTGQISILVRLPSSY